MNLEYEKINQNDGNWKIFLRQIALNSFSSVFDILISAGTGAPTVIIPQLRKEANSTETISNEMALWASSVNQFCGIPWVIILITLAHYLGQTKDKTLQEISDDFKSNSTISDVQKELVYMKRDSIEIH
ncbi:hypothetical protein evm_014458 [Chilo suppressalis]|nr:hypothetical protein evm_014458 [Chilo suppressalis]